MAYQALNEVEQMTDEEEIVYVRKNGAAKLFKELGFEKVMEGE